VTPSQLVFCPLLSSVLVLVMGPVVIANTDDVRECLEAVQAMDSPGPLATSSAGLCDCSTVSEPEATFQLVKTLYVHYHAHMRPYRWSRPCTLRVCEKRSATSCCCQVRDIKASYSQHGLKRNSCSSMTLGGARQAPSCTEYAPEFCSRSLASLGDFFTLDHLAAAITGRIPMSHNRFGLVQ
jgi:hypothetical protein